MSFPNSFEISDMRDYDFTFSGPIYIYPVLREGSDVRDMILPLSICFILEIFLYVH